MSEEKKLAVAQDDETYTEFWKSQCTGNDNVLRYFKQLEKFEYLLEGAVLGYKAFTENYTKLKPKTPAPTNQKSWWLSSLFYSSSSSNISGSAPGGAQLITFEAYLSEYVAYHIHVVLEPVGVVVGTKPAVEEKYVFNDLLQLAVPYGPFLKRDLEEFKQDISASSDVQLAFRVLTSNSFRDQVNTALRENNGDLGRFKSFLFNILLGKMELAYLLKTRRRVYVGQQDWNGMEDKFVPGTRVTFNAITSSSSKREAVEGGGVMLEIVEAEGIDVCPLSLYPNEHEIVLLPGSTFEVLEKTSNSAKLRYIGWEISERIERHVLPFLLESALVVKNQDFCLQVLKRMVQLNLDLNIELPGFRQNRTAMYNACRNGLSEVLRHLVVDQHISTFQEIEDAKSTPLHAAAFNGHASCVEILLTAPDIHKSLNHKNKYGAIPLEEANDAIKPMLELAMKRAPVQ
eukprot:TRINITY_DN14470_c0_g1_i1.p1 TRINITY_DN14470_c0_g1~~TRINITY_DN14470_c0_g1_i1.p1  ORF type:complete len:458 (-),score=123.89 TRINITY_DN14470_c0_g1_i1:54-1427(-)